MTTETNAPDFGLARLRAAAALIPIIESGLANSKLAPERAALMGEFCLWASKSNHDNCAESQLLLATISEGLERMAQQLA